LVEVGVGDEAGVSELDPICTKDEDDVLNVELGIVPADSFSCPHEEGDEVFAGQVPNCDGEARRPCTSTEKHIRGVPKSAICGLLRYATDNTPLIRAYRWRTRWYATDI
jgi:hypothetical protein